MIYDDKKRSEKLFLGLYALKTMATLTCRISASTSTLAYSWMALGTWRRCSGRGKRCRADPS